MGADRPARPAVGTTVSLALVVVLLAPVARVLFPRLYILGEDASFVVVGLIGLLVYGAPILALAFVRLPPRAATWLGVALLSAARLGVQFLHPIPTWLAVGATAAALVGTTCVILGLGGLRSLRAALPLGLVAGLALDTALRIPTGSWELVWQRGLAPAALALGTVAAASAAIASALREAPDDDPGIARAALAAIGPFLMLQLVLLQNLGGVGSSVPVSFPAAIAIVLTGDVLALDAAWLAVRYGERPGRGPAVILAIVAVVVAYVLPGLTGTAAIMAVLALQAITAGCLAFAAARRGAATRVRTVVAMTVGTLGFLLLALLWQLHIDRPLPFPRAAVPALAALGLGVTALAAARHPARRQATHPALAAASASVALAVVVGAITAVAWPGTLAATPGGAEVTIVSFNVRGGLRENAMLDADAIADSIAASDPDVVLLQEVARGWPVFGQYDLLARLSQRLRMPYRYEPAADAQFGNAIFSRLPMTPVVAGPLPEVQGSQGRSFLVVRVEKSAGPLLVTNAHLESDSVAQIDALLAAVGGETPAVVAGDLNMETTDTANVERFVAAGLTDAEGATGDACRTTSAAPMSDCDRPDWVWVSDDLRIVGFEIGAPSASDHLPVEVTVAMP